MGRGDFFRWPESRPRKVKGGIRARSRRGAFAESWWAGRWLEVLESFGIGKRLDRARTYARQGQVVDLEVERGGVEAVVQGSRKQPYRAEIALEPLTDGERGAVARELAGRPRVLAALLNGEMPEELEDAFAGAGVALFPGRSRDLRTECSCPDWSNPCKHIAAVYYLLAEELDRDPFLLLTLRGLARSDLLSADPGEGGDSGGAGPEGDGEGGADAGPVGAAEPLDVGAGIAAIADPGANALPTDPEAFWNGEPEGGAEGEIGAGGGTSANASDGGAEPAGEGAPTGSESPRVQPSDVEPVPTGSTEETPAVHLRKLGRIPFWRGETDPVRELEAMIHRAVPLGLELMEAADPRGMSDE